MKALRRSLILFSGFFLKDLGIYSQTAMTQREIACIGSPTSMLDPMAKDQLSKVYMDSAPCTQYPSVCLFS